MDAMAAAVVIPLVALAFPIVLILLAVLIDLVALLWFGYRYWHDEWSGRVGHYIRDRIAHPMGTPRPILPH